MTGYVSPYLRLPLRTEQQAREDIERKKKATDKD